MRLRKISNADEIVKSSIYYLDTNNLKLEINNKKNVELEIGMGKGDFLINKAISNPDIFYIGIEKYASVLVRCIEKLENENIKNIKVMLIDASIIDEIFKNSIGKLYLNFSDPWPKRKHIERRLTSNTFLQKYENIFKNEKIIEMKTDNINLFNFSKKTFIKNKYKIISESNDFDSLYKTEYEKKFISKNVKINHILVVK